MIPKIIHYCWFGRNPLPDEYVEYINNWKRLNPDFEIIRWDEDNFPIDLCDYSREAYQMKEWAFVSDVCRLYALLKFGGIYLDTDMQLLKPLNSLLCNNSFLGKSNEDVEMGIIGADISCSWIKYFLEEYYP